MRLKVGDFLCGKHDFHKAACAFMGFGVSAAVLSLRIPQNRKIGDDSFLIVVRAFTKSKALCEKRKNEKRKKKKKCRLFLICDIIYSLCWGCIPARSNAISEGICLIGKSFFVGWLLK
jgi:hypothetical protein